ncbi:zeta toxin family protein, partial [Streptomyces sp. MK37H]|uniref:zeta toxin family protein n=1 Tax=Streptomyces sp. MK37H TaxID=2699117 RepID=UPI001B35FCB9
MRVGSAATRLIVLRGNSASGKSSVAAGLRARHGRGLALVAQDNLRRVVPVAETLRRHATKPQADEYGEREMREWYRPLDLLPGGVETVVPATSALEETVERVMRDAGWA